MAKPQIIHAIATSLISPRLTSRQLSAEMLVFFCHLTDQTHRTGLSMVQTAFDQLEQRLNAAITDISQKVGRFEVWLKQLEQTIDGRGRMGSMVGVSNDLKGQDDHSLVEYCVSLVRVRVLGVS